eukprot:463731-Pleurochrysis_carterae.AAC.3
MNAESSQLISLNGSEDFGSRVLPMINNIIYSAESNRYVMRIATKFYTLNPSFIQKLNARYEPKLIVSNTEITINSNSTRESDEEIWDAIDDDENGAKELELIKLSPSNNYEFDLGGKRSYSKARGAFFAFIHSFTDEYVTKTLARIGCHKELDTHNYTDNCFIIALKQSKLIDSKTIEHAKTLIQCSKISRSNLHKIVSFNPDVEIIVTSDDLKRTTYKQKLTKKEQNENSKTVHLALIKDHYFLIFDTEITSYAIRNYDRLKNGDKWWQFRDDKHRNPERGMNTINLIRELMKTDSLLTPIKPSDHTTFCLTNREKKIPDCNVYETLEYPDEACRPKHAPRDFGFKFDKRMKQTLNSYFEGGTRAENKNESPKDAATVLKKKLSANTPAIGNASKRNTKRHSKEFFIHKFTECGLSTIGAQNALLQKYLPGEYTTYFFDFEAISSSTETTHLPYMCCWMLDEDHTRVENANGEDCAKTFLDTLCERHGVIYDDESTCIPSITIYAHNVTYDLSFIFKHLKRIDFVERGSSVVCGTARYYRMDGVQCGGSNHNLYLYLRDYLELNPDDSTARRTKNFVYSCKEYLSSFQDLIETFPDAIDCRNILENVHKWFEMSGIVFRPKVINLYIKDSYKMISSALRDLPKMFSLENVQKEVMPYDLFTCEFGYGPMEGVCTWDYILQNCGEHFIDFDELKSNLNRC